MKAGSEKWRLVLRTKTWSSIGNRLCQYLPLRFPGSVALLIRNPVCTKSSVSEEASSRRRWMPVPLLVFAVSTFACNGNARKAFGSGPLQQSAAPTLAARGLCGVSSLYACCSALGKEVDPATLVSERYASQLSGSTAADLLTAVSDLGLSGRYLSHLNCRDLDWMKWPMMLHVRNASQSYNHWVAFMGVDDSQGRRYRCLDHGRGERLLTAAELMSIWSGNGIAVAPAGVQPGVSWLGRAEAFAPWLLLLAGLAVAHRIRSGPGAVRRGRIAPEMMLLLLFSAGSALAVHLLDPAGFFGNRGGLADLVSRYSPADVPTVGLEELQRSLDSSSPPVLIDARIPDSYARGTIRNAISLPISATVEERGRIARQFDRQVRLVVFCQSESCLWSHDIARFLVASGFRDVVIYPGGINEWQDHEAR